MLREASLFECHGWVRLKRGACSRTRSKAGRTHNNTPIKYTSYNRRTRARRLWQWDAPSVQGRIAGVVGEVEAGHGEGRRSSRAPGQAEEAIPVDCSCGFRLETSRYSMGDCGDAVMLLLWWSCEAVCSGCLYVWTSILGRAAA